MPAVDIRRAAKKAIPGLLQAKQEKLNEADTVQRIMRFFEKVLGYDFETELSREQQQQGRYLDLAIKIDKKVQLIVEVKKAGTELARNHLDQAQRYANEFKIWWAVLTNGTHWILYHFVTSKTGIDAVPVVDVDLSDEEKLEENLEALACLHRQNLTPETLQAVYRQIQVTSPKVIIRGLFTEEVLKVLAREINREHQVRFEVGRLRELLGGMLSEEVQESVGGMRVKKAKRRVISKEPHAIEVSGVVQGAGGNAAEINQPSPETMVPQHESQPESGQLDAQKPEP